MLGPAKGQQARLTVCQAAGVGGCGHLGRAFVRVVKGWAQDGQGAGHGRDQQKVVKLPGGHAWTPWATGLRAAAAKSAVPVSVLSLMAGTRGVVGEVVGMAAPVVKCLDYCLSYSEVNTK
jgi:hypothetical protein